MPAQQNGHVLQPEHDYVLNATMGKNALAKRTLEATTSPKNGVHVGANSVVDGKRVNKKRSHADTVANRPPLPTTTTNSLVTPLYTFSMWPLSTWNIMHGGMELATQRVAPKWFAVLVVNTEQETRPMLRKTQQPWSLVDEINAREEQNKNRRRNTGASNNNNTKRAHKQQQARQTNEILAAAAVVNADTTQQQQQQGGVLCHRCMFEECLSWLSFFMDLRHEQKRQKRRRVAVHNSLCERHQGDVEDDDPELMLTTRHQCDKYKQRRRRAAGRRSPANADDSILRDILVVQNHVQSNRSALNGVDVGGGRISSMLSSSFATVGKASGAVKSATLTAISSSSGLMSTAAAYDVSQPRWFETKGKYRIGQINGPFSSEQEVDKYIEIWSSGNRGTISKAARGEVLARHFGLETYGDLSVIFLNENTKLYIKDDQQQQQQERVDDEAKIAN